MTELDRVEATTSIPTAYQHRRVPMGSTGTVSNASDPAGWVHVHWDHLDMIISVLPHEIRPI